MLSLSKRTSALVCILHSNPSCFQRIPNLNLILFSISSKKIITLVAESHNPIQIFRLNYYSKYMVYHWWQNLRKRKQKLVVASMSSVIAGRSSVIFSINTDFLLMLSFHLSLSSTKNIWSSLQVSINLNLVSFKQIIKFIQFSISIPP